MLCTEKLEFAKRNSLDLKFYSKNQKKKKLRQKEAVYEEFLKKFSGGVNILCKFLGREKI